MSEDIVWVASVDIGKKNFAFYIEEFDRSKFGLLPNVTKTSRYNRDGTTTPAFANVVKRVCNNGKVILHENVDITTGCGDAYLDPEMFHNMTDILDHYSNYWDQCDAFVIEQQMSFGKTRKNEVRNNTMAVKLGQHCWSYFAFRYGRFRPVVEFPAYYKTQILGAPKVSNGKTGFKAMDKPARKKWSIDKATAILAEREDFRTLNILTSSRKKDDLADVICQLQAFKILVYVDKSI